MLKRIIRYSKPSELTAEVENDQLELYQLFEGCKLSVSLFSPPLPSSGRRDSAAQRDHRGTDHTGEDGERHFPRQSIITAITVASAAIPSSTVERKADSCGLNQQWLQGNIWQALREHWQRLASRLPADLTPSSVHIDSQMLSHYCCQVELGGGGTMSTLPRPIAAPPVNSIVDVPISDMLTSHLSTAMVHQDYRCTMHSTSAPLKTLEGIIARLYTTLQHGASAALQEPAPIHIPLAKLIPQHTPNPGVVLQVSSSLSVEPPLLSLDGTTIFPSSQLLSDDLVPVKASGVSAPASATGQGLEEAFVRFLSFAQAAVQKAATKEKQDQQLIAKPTLHITKRKKTMHGVEPSSRRSSLITAIVDHAPASPRLADERHKCTTLPPSVAIIDPPALSNQFDRYLVDRCLVESIALQLPQPLHQSKHYFMAHDEPKQNINFPDLFEKCASRTRTSHNGLDRAVARSIKGLSLPISDIPVHLTHPPTATTRGASLHNIFRTAHQAGTWANHAYVQPPKGRPNVELYIEAVYVVLSRSHQAVLEANYRDRREDSNIAMAKLLSIPPPRSTSAQGVKKGFELPEEKAAGILLIMLEPIGVLLHAAGLKIGDLGTSSEKFVCDVLAGVQELPLYTVSDHVLRCFHAAGGTTGYKRMRTHKMDPSSTARTAAACGVIREGARFLQAPTNEIQSHLLRRMSSSAEISAFRGVIESLLGTSAVKEARQTAKDTQKRDDFADFDSFALDEGWYLPSPGDLSSISYGSWRDL